jgi:hypothetical protein
MTSQWAAKRKFVYGSIALITCVVAVGVPLFWFLYKTPTCFDDKKNQNEKGVDCGGTCSKLCPSDITAPIVIWQRVFETLPGVYNAVAYIQNPNVLTRVDNVGYVFRLYDKDNVLITQKSGRTFLPANQVSAVFESGIRTGTQVPSRASFEFSESPSWIQNLPSYREPVLAVENITLNDNSSLPRINAEIRNLSLDPVKTLGVVAIVYDAEDNAIGVSQTLVENLGAASSQPVTFTWPVAFKSPVVRKEIILRIYPDGIAY